VPLKALSVSLVVYSKASHEGGVHDEATTGGSGDVLWPPGGLRTGPAAQEAQGQPGAILFIHNTFLQLGKPENVYGKDVSDNKYTEVVRGFREMCVRLSRSCF